MDDVCNGAVVTKQRGLVARPRRGTRSRVIGLTVGLVAFVIPTAVVMSPASARASDCHSYTTSSGKPGGGMSGICYGGPGWYQEVGLCQNIFNLSSRWVDGPWVSGGVSYAKCSWYEKPVGGFVRIGA
jgi:hypothetical protein